MVSFILRLIDLFTPLALLYGLHSGLAEMPWRETYFWVGVFAGLFLFISTQLMGGYQQYHRRTIARKLEIVFQSWLYILLLIVFIAYIWGDVGLISRKTFLVWSAVTPIVIILSKILVSHYFSPQNERKFLMLGDCYQFTQFEQHRLRMQGIVVDCVDRLEKLDAQKFCEQISGKSYQTIILNIKEQPKSEVIQCLTRLELNGVRLMSMNHFFEKFLRKCFIPYDVRGVDYLDDIHGYTRSQYVLKRVLDYFSALFLLVISSPVMLYAVYKIKKESPGTIIFRQLRVGKDLKEFTLYKFRSMHENAEVNGAKFALENDPRAYEFGAKMRKTRIDELPQLWNVLKGDLHLVGPRPERKVFTDDLEKEIPFYHMRHLVRPGITGWAQVMYPYGANVEDARQKLMYDLYYIKYWSIWLELETIIRTVGVILGKKGR